MKVYVLVCFGHEGTLFGGAVFSVPDKANEVARNMNRKHFPTGYAEPWGYEEVELDEVREME